MQDHSRPVVVNVFSAGPGGGNPAPIVLDASGMSDADMQGVARHHGFESGFVLPAPPGSGHDYELRFWVPNHEMSMCGHATVGAVWLLAREGMLRSDMLRVLTRSGTVNVAVGGRGSPAIAVEVSQPAGVVDELTESDFDKAELLDILRITETDLAPLPILNASTSRVKTLVPIAGVETLNELSPDFDRIEKFCESIGSTGLYPYAVIDLDEQVIDARQFPKSSGYPEDAATGIAAAALAFGLLTNGMVRDPGRPILVNQGRAMKRPSLISVRLETVGSDVVGCWLGGQVTPDDRP
ncbi:PhzF family phenazine biosynthesis isomerase [Shinella sp. CPCC 101442]|uniref:PhzF family phenazine biosynthesis protein n=1 Tax=Shinella sp. CPCC 101442 TaxID=2932265 RepID=UPI002152B650|nr:PhzF family phenazine biosynthesis isomerase [Shinella sp. CPCC 101442]MCR6501310.1 PhzF family phenazine biosynthesis isomerase [Shinella sp. CPCC 101442]